jgi:general secretion pathway protein C
MSALLKKHFWAVNLAAIAALAWSASATVSTLVGSALFVVPEAPEVSALATSAAGAARDMGRIPGDLGASDTLSVRHVFDLRPPPEGDEEDASDEMDGEETELDSSGKLEESELPIELVGTLVTEESATSMATLSVSGESKLGWVGTELLDGQATLAAIAPRHIVVREGASLKVIRLWADKGAAGKAGTGGPGRKGAARGAGSRGAAARATAAAKATTSSKPKKTDFSKGVKKTGPYDYQIDRGMLDEQLADLSKLGSQARVVPNYRNGKYEGFKLVGVRPGSLYRSIGVRSGDVIKSVNGKPIDSPNKALDLFEQLKASSSIQLEIERRGQPKQLNYSIQ